MSTIKHLFTLASNEEVKGFQYLPQVSKALKGILSLVSRILGNSMQPAVLERKKELDKKELLKYSELSKPISQALKKVLDSSMFQGKKAHALAAIVGHMLGGSILKGSRLQNLPAHTGTQLLEAHLQEGNFFEGDDALLSGLKKSVHSMGQTAREIDALPEKMKEARSQRTTKSDSEPDKTIFFNYVHKTMERVYTLQEGDSFFIGAEGVEDSLTHSVLYEFKKKKGNLYDLFIYTIGQKNALYGVTGTKNHRTWVKPFSAYENIPASALFFNGPQQQNPQIDFFQALLETKINRDTYSFTPSYTSLKIVNHLHSYAVFPPQELCGFMSTALGHVDGWFEEKAVFFRYLGSINYKKLILEIKFRSLVEGYQLGQDQLQSESIEGDELRTVLKVGCDKLLKRLIKYERNGWLSESALRRIRATVLDLQDKIGALEEDLSRARQKKIASLTYIERDTKNKLRAHLETEKKTIQLPKTEKISVQSIPPQLPLLGPPTQFLRQLREFIVHLQGNTATQSVEIEQWVAQFSIPESPSSDRYWDQIPLQELPAAINRLENLLRIYDVAARAGSIKIAPHEANTVFSLYMIIHFLALRREKQSSTLPENDPGRLSAYPLYFPGELYENDPYLIYTSPRDFHKRSQIIAYCKATHFETKEPQTAAQKKSEKPLWNFSVFNDCQEESYTKHPITKFLYHLVQVSLSNKKFFPGTFENILDLLPHLSPMRDFNWFNEEDVGLAYIPSLAYAAFMALQYSGYTHLRSDPEGLFRIKVDKQTGWGKCTYAKLFIYAGGQHVHGFSDNSSTILSPHSDSLLPKLGEHAPLPLHAQAKRKRTPTLHDEATILLENKDGHTSTLLRATCEPGLQPYQMLYHYHNRFDVLSAPHEQAFFELEFFRSVVTAQGERFPLLEATAQKGFVQKCRRFIEEGVERYFYLQVGHRPHVMATLFFIRLSIRLARFVPTSLFDPLSYIKKMQELSDLTEEEKSALSIHFIASLQTQKKPLSDEHKIDMVRSWIHYKNTLLPAEWKNELFEKETFSFLITQVESSPSSNFVAAFYKPILQEALQLIGIKELPEHFVLQTCSFPNVRAEGREGEFWEVNLLTGKICNEQGELVRGATPDWIPKEKHAQTSEATDRFHALFGAREHTYFKSGTTIYFQDPIFGSLRVVGGDILHGLQRKIGAHWYQFIHHSSLTYGEVPASLLADHTHWLPIDKRETHLWICDLKTGIKKAYIDHLGAIHPCLPDSETIDESRTLEISYEEQIVERMEQKKYIVFAKKEGVLETISFPRFRTQSQQVLEFSIEKGQAVYQTKRKFYISQQQVGGLLGGISQYLLLTDQKGEKQKLLIPARPLSRYVPLSSQHQIDTKDLQKPRSSSAYETQSGIYTVLEFDLKNGQIIPLTPEGTLYLAYIYLAQRKYIEARNLIDQIDFRTPFSDLSIQIIKYVTELCQPERDFSSCCAAVVIAAYHLLQKAQTRHKKPLGCPRPESAFTLYYRFQNAIPAGLEILPKKTDEPKLTASNPSYLFDEFPKSLDLELPKPGRTISEKGYEEGQNHYYVRELTRFLVQEQHSAYSHPKIYLSTYYGKGYAEQCFSEAYEIAKNGTQEEREKLKFRLHLMEELRCDRTQSDLALKNRPMGWTILHFALLYPHLAPPLPEKEIMAAWKFLLKVNELIGQERANFSKTSSGQGHGPTIEALPDNFVFKEIALPAKEVRAVPHPLQLVSTGRVELDNGFLQKMYGYFVKTPIPDKKQEELPFTYDPAWAKSVEEKLARKPIETECANFAKNVNEGGQKMQQRRVTYTCTDLPTVRSELTQKSGHLATDLQNLEVAILEIANRAPPCPRD